MEKIYFNGKEENILTSISVEEDKSPPPIFPEKENYNSLIEGDYAFYFKNLKDRYPDLNKYKYVSDYDFDSNALEPFIKYMIDNPDKAHDVVLYRDIFYKTEEIPYFKAFTIIDEKFAFVYKREIDSGGGNVFIFFNNLNEIKNKFFKKDPRNYKPGIYELAIENDDFVIHPISLRQVDKPILDREISDKIHEDITCFFNNEKFYRDNNLAYKRGLIIHGPPGNGKTTLIKDVLTSYPDSYRLMIDCKYFEQSLYDFIQKIFPANGKKIIIFEDVEAIGAGARSYSKRSSFLNFIDGAKVMENTLFIATTNHPDLVDPALIDRPSRFDRVYKVDLPKEDCRKRFLLKYFPYLKEQPNNLKQHIKDTIGFSGAYFKELFIVVGIQEIELSKAVAELKKQIKIRAKGDFNEKTNLGLNV